MKENTETVALHDAKNFVCKTCEWFLKENRKFIFSGIPKGKVTNLKFPGRECGSEHFIHNLSPQFFSGIAISENKLVFFCERYNL